MAEDKERTPAQDNDLTTNALLREREGYVARAVGAGADDPALKARMEGRIKQVDDQLRERGHKGKEKAVASGKETA